MKQTTTPAIKYIDGQPFVRVIDLGHQWHTNTSNILAIGKRHHVPEEQLRRIDGRVWCSFQGLRYRVAATKHGSSIAGRIREFLDSQAEKTETKQAQATEPAATDLGTAALIADARRTASQALAKTQELSGKLDRLTDAIHHNQNKTTDNATAVHVAKDTANTALATATQAADLAQENADMITVTGDRISLRLDRLSEHVDHVEKDAIAHRCDALERVRQAERNQRDTAARIGTLEEHVRAVEEKKANQLKDIPVMPPAVADEGTSVTKHDMHVINMQCALIISVLIGTVGIGVLAGCIWRFC